MGRLQELDRDFQFELNRCKDVFSEAAPAGCVLPPHLADPVLLAAGSFCLIQLHDAWARFCWLTVYWSALGRTSTLSGTALPRARHLSRSQAPDAFLRAHWGNNWGRFGPAWHVSTNSTKAANLLGIHNESNVTAALLASGEELEDLRLFRNYLAHRTRSSSTECEKRWAHIRRRLNLAAQEFHPSQIPAYEISTSYRLFDYWCDAISRRAKAVLA